MHCVMLATARLLGTQLEKQSKQTTTRMVIHVHVQSHVLQVSNEIASVTLQCVWNRNGTEMDHVT